MLMPLCMIVFLSGLLVSISIHILNRNDLDPSMHFLAILILAPFVLFAVKVMRLHL
jgi:hypothetical protein